MNKGLSYLNLMKHSAASLQNHLKKFKNLNLCTIIKEKVLHICQRLLGIKGEWTWVDMHMNAHNDALVFH